MLVSIDCDLWTLHPLVVKWYQMFNPAADSIPTDRGKVMLSNLNSMQSTLQDLKEIVTKNQGANHETSAVVRQMEVLLSDLELKAQNNTISLNDLPLSVPPSVQPAVVT